MARLDGRVAIITGASRGIVDVANGFLQRTLQGVIPFTHSSRSTDHAAALGGK